MAIIEIHLDSVDSTNNYAKIHGSSFDPNIITCITAEEQTAGRGRYERKWVSPRGVNLNTTFYFHLSRDISDLTAIGLVMAHSVTSLLIRKKLQPHIKWPNDIQLQGKKLSGILSETVFHETHIEMIVGIGINVNMDQEMLDTIDQPATSLKVETKGLWDRRALLKELQTEFVRDLELFKQKGFTPFREALEKLLAYRGEEISVFNGATTWQGVCERLTPTGGLVLLLKDHTHKIFFSGDVHMKKYT